MLHPRLILDFGGHIIELSARFDRPFYIGRSQKNDLIINDERISHSHAAIEFRQGKFVLVDHSTNGTYLLLDNGERFFIRREEFILQGRGIICLGQAAFEKNPDAIRYACEYPA